MAAKEIGVDELEIRSMYEDGKLSKVSIHHLLVMVSSKPRPCSLLLNNSRSVISHLSEFMCQLTGLSLGILKAQRWKCQWKKE